MVANNRTCQKCARPIDTDDIKGTEVDGMLNEVYCLYCYKDGSFTHEHPMDDMVELAAPARIKTAPLPKGEEVREVMHEFYPDPGQE